MDKKSKSLKNNDSDKCYAETKKKTKCNKVAKYGNYCDKHKFYNDYTDEQFNNLTPCEGECGLKKYIPNGNKCDNCIKRTKNKSDKQRERKVGLLRCKGICRDGKSCIVKESKLDKDEYCKKHSYQKKYTDNDKKKLVKCNCCCRMKMPNTVCEWCKIARQNINTGKKDVNIQCEFITSTKLLIINIGLGILAKSENSLTRFSICLI